jgi:putative transposase
VAAARLSIESVERGVKPRRIDAVTRIDLYLLSRLFDWRDSLVVVPVMSNYTDDTRRDQPDSVASHESCRSIYSVAMSSLLQPLHLLLMMFAGWVNRHQLDMIDYLQEENRVLKERLGGRRIHFTDAERRLLARKVYALGRKVLNELETLVTPDTLLRWHGQLVASKWNYTQRRGPGAAPRHADNRGSHSPYGGVKYFVGIHTDPRRAGLGHQVGRGTIANVLREHGIEPAPERDRHARWSTFLKAHWECLTATDFLSVEVYTISGLVTYYIPFFIDIASRSAHIAGITSHPDNRWMTQIARNLTDAEDGILRDTRYLILDRDTKYCDEFRSVLVREGIHLIRLPPRSPNLYVAA